MLNIVFEDKDKIIVNKPSGQLSQSGKNFDLDVVSEVLNYRRMKKEEPYAAIINRLDRNVSGLVLLAKNKQAAARYSKIMQQGTSFNKQYHALVCGQLESDCGEYVDYLVKDGKENTSHVATKDTKDAKEAKLTYEVIRYDSQNDVTLVKINLLTGRHHQIRVQFSSRNHVLLGDYKYDKKEHKTAMDELVKACALKRNEIALCATSITVDGKEFSIKYPV